MFTKNVKLVTIMGLLVIAMVLGMSMGADAQIEPEEDDDENIIEQVGMVAIFGIALVVNIAILVWIYKDAEKRGKSGIGWLIFALICGPIACIAWLLVRPKI